MKFAILIVCVLAFSLADGECSIFSCASLKNSGDGAKNCTSKITTDSVVSYKVQ